MMSSVLRTLFAMLVLAAGVVACGGGAEQIAGVGTGGSGFASGVVTGLGSIIVDGEAWNDAAAPVEVEVDPRGPAVTGQTVRLGQRVQIEYRSAGVADRIRIEATLTGTVDRAVTSGAFSALGQTVRLNAGAGTGPLTLLAGGYATDTDIQPGQLIEVHGSLVFTGAGYAIAATRVEKLQVLPGGLYRITGVVEDLAPDRSSFRIGALTVRVPSTADVGPAGRVLAPGQRVVVWGSRLLSGPSPVLTAQAVRIRDALPASAGAASQVAGVVGRLTGSTFEVNGFRVDAAGARVVPSSETLTEGRYAIARGSFDAAGVLRAEQIRIRRRSSDEPAVELTGLIGDFVSLRDFQVRAVRVDAGSARLIACAGLVLRDGVRVRVTGEISADRVLADEVQCQRP